MNRALLLVMVSGCFYTDPINQRPSIDIVRRSGDAVYRGDVVELDAVSNDPENHFVWFQWRAYACTTASVEGIGTADGCDQEPFYTEILDSADLVVPPERVGAEVPVSQVLVLLEGEDDFGATAKPVQQLVLTIDNHAPSLMLRKDSRYGYVVDTSVNVYAKVGDQDDGRDTPTITWTVFSPMNQPNYTFEDISVPQDPDDPDHRQLGKTLRPAGIGDYEVEVKATDPLGAVSTQRVTITVVPDHAPCLAQWAPIDAPAGSALPITEPTLFQVNVVNDDLDRFPEIAGDAELGVTDFKWSLLPPGASSRQVLATTSNQVAIDPASYSPGSIVELRVEIADRNDTAITCTDNSPTCSVISDASCIQRLTWRVEVR